MREDAPLISVVIVCYKNTGMLEDCLRSIKNQTYRNIEMVLVNNGSPLCLESFVGPKFPGIVHVKLDENTGFAAGHNRGIEKARGDYVAILNDDAIAESNWIEKLFEAMGENTDAAAVASVVYDYNKYPLLDSLGVGICLDGMSRQLLKGREKPATSHETEFLLFSGCACMFRRSALEQVGLFDEDFFAFCEDTDLSLRMILAGWRIVLAPEAEVRHYGSLTSGAFSTRKIFWVERNHYWVAIKNFPWQVLFLLPFFTLYRYFLQLYLLIFKSDTPLTSFVQSSSLREIIWCYIMSMVDSIRFLPKMIKKRLEINRFRKKNSWHLLRLIVGNKLTFRAGLACDPSCERRLSD